MAEKLEVKNESWTYVKDRILNRGKIYKLANGSKYLRIGETKEINAEAVFVNDLYLRGFPVPKVLEVGEIGGRTYYIEQSVGDKNFGERFHSEFASNGSVSNKTFLLFCETMCHFLHAQLVPNNHIKTGSDLRNGISLANVLQENPEIDKHNVEKTLTKIEDKLRPLPVVLTHGDLSPRNVFEHGIIDFEFKFFGPVGYDVLTAITVGRFWNYQRPDGNIPTEFDFNQEQTNIYFNRIDSEANKYGIENLSMFTDEFILLKAVWSLAHEKESAIQTGNKTKWEFRKAVLTYCIEQYLDDKKIDTSDFIRLNKH